MLFCMDHICVLKNVTVSALTVNCEVVRNEQTAACWDNSE